MTIADTVHLLGLDLGLTGEQITALATVCLVVVTLATNVFLVLLARRQANAAKIAAAATQAAADQAKRSSDAAVQQASELKAQREEIADAAFPEIEADAAYQPVKRYSAGDFPSEQLAYYSHGWVVSVKYVNGSALASSVIAFARFPGEDDKRKRPTCISWDFGVLSPSKATADAEPQWRVEKLNEMPFSKLVRGHRRYYAGVRWMGPGAKGRWWLRLRNSDGSFSIHRGTWLAAAPGISAA